ncbi:MAG: hypothetical protein FWF41_04465 [Betaproteobacteria bacterium]|nr:hypothetical protein [Betaproteobacteria bacterium]
MRHRVPVDKNGRLVLENDFCPNFSLIVLVGIDGAGQSFQKTPLADGVFFSVRFYLLFRNADSRQNVKIQKMNEAFFFKVFGRPYLMLRVLDKNLRDPGGHEKFLVDSTGCAGFCQTVKNMKNQRIARSFLGDGFNGQGAVEIQPLHMKHHAVRRGDFFDLEIPDAGKGEFASAASGGAHSSAHAARQRQQNDDNKFEGLRDFHDRGTEWKVEGLRLPSAHSTRA